MIKPLCLFCRDGYGEAQQGEIEKDDELEG
jgi:hypothetical protein